MKAGAGRLLTLVFVSISAVPLSVDKALLLFLLLYTLKLQLLLQDCLLAALLGGK